METAISYGGVVRIITRMKQRRDTKVNCARESFPARPFASLGKL